MVSKVEVYQRLETTHSLYRAMLGSGNPSDLANAEAYRLATQEWQEVALALDAQKAGTQPFNPEIHLARIRSRWMKYVNTGVPHDSIDELLKRHAQENEKFLWRRSVEQRRLAIEKGEKNPPTELPKPSFDAPKPKKGKPAELPPGDPRHHINPMIIQGILNEFRQAFDLPMIPYKTEGVY